MKGWYRRGHSLWDPPSPGYDMMRDFQVPPAEGVRVHMGTVVQVELGLPGSHCESWVLSLAF